MRTWIARALSHFGEPSTKRTVVFVAACTLCFVTLSIGIGCSIWIHYHGDLGTGAVAALTFAGGITASLAGVAYRKLDGPAGSPAPSSVVPETLPAGSDK